METLLSIITEKLKLKSIEVTLLIPYIDSGAAAKLFEEGTVLSQDYEAEGIGDRYDLVMEEHCEFYMFDHIYYLYQRNENPVSE